MDRAPTQKRSPRLRLVALAVGATLAGAGALVWRDQSSAPVDAEMAAAPSPPRVRADGTVRMTDLPLEVKNPSLLDVAVHPDGDLVVAVGTEGTLLRSDDGGINYARVETHTRESLVRALVLREQGTILVVGSSGTLLRSIDRARTFARVPSGTDSTLNALAESETGTIVVVGDNGVALSSADRGERFAREDIGRAKLLTELVALAGSPGAFVAAGESGSVVLRDVSGQWLPIDPPSQTFVTALESLADGTLLAGLAEGTIVRSTDRGVHWTEVFGGRDQNYVLGFAATPDGAVVLARLRDRRLVRSHDGGRTFSVVDVARAKAPTALTWVPGRGFIGVASDGGTLRSNLEGGLLVHTASSASVRVTKLAANPKAGSVIGVGPSGFIGRLAPLATRFDVIAPDLGGLLHALAQAPDTGTIVAVGTDATVVRSVDGGKTFERRGAGLPAAAELGALTYAPAHASFVAATTKGAVYRSQDDGESFRKSAELGDEVLALAAVGADRVMALGVRQGARLSSDGGKTFGPPIAGLTGTLRYAAPGCSPNSVLAVGDGGALYRSTNGATSFERVDAQVTSALRHFACDTTKGRTWVVGDHGTLLRSEDGFATFRRVPLPTDENLFTVGLSAKGDVVYVGGNGGTLLCSTDGGQSFTPVATGSRQPVRITAYVSDVGEFVIGGVGGLLMLTTNQTTAYRLSGHFEGRFDHFLYHAATKSLVVAGDRLLRLTIPERR